MDKEEVKPQNGDETTFGTVVEALPNTMFRVKLDSEDGKSFTDENPEEIITYLSGKMRLYRIRVLVGDRVEVVIDPYGGKGRVVRRH